MTVKTLILVRHAKAEPVSPGMDDHSRALSLVGRAAATEAGQRLAEAGFAPSVALVSDATRTVQTWQLMSPAFGDVETTRVAGLYDSTVGTVHSLLGALAPDVECAVVVGHEPTISATAAFLAGAESDRTAMQRIAHGLPTGAAAILTFDGEWADLGSRSATLVTVSGTQRSDQY